MATSTVMQAFLVSPIVGTARKSHSYPAQFLPTLRRRFSTTVMSTSQGNQKEEAAEAVTTPTPPPPPPKRGGTSITDVLAFAGPGPERINGRLAMIGFVGAMAVEASKGQDLISQITEGSGVGWFLGTTALLSLASLIPLLKGVSAESKSSGVMTSDAELWNGRFAMLGLVALAFTEYLKGSALV